MFDIFFEHTVTCYAPTTSEDGGGGVSVVWTTVRQAGIPCLVKAAMLKADARFGGGDLTGTATVAMYEGSAVRRGDLFVVTGGNRYVGRRLRVEGIQDQDPVAAIGFPDVIYHFDCEVIG